MADRNNITSIKKNKFKINFDIGIVIFGLIFIYLIANLVIYLTNSHISVYEVCKGSIITDNAYTGFAVRSEEVTYANMSGYVRYLVNEGDKVAVGNAVYTFSEDEDKTDSSEQESGLQASELKELIGRTQKFNLAYDPVNFKQVYNFDYDCQSSILDSKNSLEASDEDIANVSESEKAAVDGIVAFTIDGFEGTTKENFQSSYLNRSDYIKQDVRSREKTKNGEPLYKTITDDTWYLFLSISDDTAKALEKMESLDVRFKKDNEIVSGKLALTKEDDQNIACLEFDNSVMRYANERYLDVELILDNQSGLKIPKTSVVEKEFYAVPNVYITKGGNTNSSGVYVKSKNGKGYSSVFTALDIYDSDENYSYVPVSAFDEGTVLLKPESTDTYEIGKTKKLKGVFNVNKGYTVFRLITVLSSNDTYYIVRENESYGLCNYDQIVLDGSKVKEDEIVF